MGDALCLLLVPLNQVTFDGIVGFAGKEARKGVKSADKNQNLSGIGISELSCWVGEYQWRRINKKMYGATEHITAYANMAPVAHEMNG